MIALVRLFLSLVGSLLKPKLRLAAENAALRHQLIVLRRKMRGRAYAPPVYMIKLTATQEITPYQCASGRGEVR